MKQYILISIHYWTDNIQFSVRSCICYYLDWRWKMIYCLIENTASLCCTEWIYTIKQKKNFSRKLLTTLQVVQPKSIYTSFIDLNTIKSIFNWIQMNKTKGFSKYLKIHPFSISTQLKPFSQKITLENYFIHLL